MKVLITTDWNMNAVNGVVTSVMNLSEELLKRGHDVRILTLSEDIHSSEEDNVLYVGSISARLVYPGARVRIRPARKIIKELYEWSPDVIHSQCEMSTFLTAFRMSRKLHIPLIHTYHTVYEDYTHYFTHSKRLGKYIVQVFSDFISIPCNCMIAPTEKVKSLLEGYKIACPIEVIPTGIDINKYRQRISKEEKEALREKFFIPKDAVVAVFVGRVAKEKNIIELVKYISKITKYDNLYFAIVGGGPDYEEVMRETEKHTEGENIVFTGMVSPEDVWKYYQMGDFFVSASTSETQGLTYIEALASGLPLLCRADECLDDVIIDGVNGHQYHSEEEFMQYFDDVIAGVKDGKYSQEKVTETAEKFSKEKFAESAEAVYEKALQLTE